MMPEHHGNHHARFTRRSVLKAALAAPAVGSVLHGCAFAGIKPDPQFLALPSTRTGDVLLGQFNAGPDAVAQAAEQLDFSWLSRGDHVLLKLASNSPYPHPSTTHPDAVAGMVRVLKARGAGRVVVADQAGVEWVRYREGSRHVSQDTTRDVLQKNGILPAALAAGAEVEVFDLNPYDSGYFPAGAPPQSHWEVPIQIPSVVRQVDHIIYLPRLGAHAMTGYTMALKLAVGWMRDDTRLDLHLKANDFFKKCTETTWVPEIRDRLRLAFTYATDILLDVGPDIGTKVALPRPTVVASTHPADHDAVGLNILLAMDAQRTSPLDVLPLYPLNANLANRYLLQFWDDDVVRGVVPMEAAPFWEGVEQDPSLRHAYVLDGVRPERIRVRMVGDMLPEFMVQRLRGYDGGLLDLVRV